MKPLHAFALFSALAGISGCPTRDKYDRLPTVRITSPAPDTYTNGIVHITASIDPILDLPVGLRLDGMLLMTLASPSTSFDWNTAGVLEGPHTLIAEVEFSNGLATSAPVTVMVDRKKPTVALTPAPGATNVMIRSPIRAAFSEPVVLLSPASSAFFLSVNGTRIPATVTLDAENLGATIAIDDLTSVPLPTVLSGSITATITDRAGNRLEPPSDWSWQVPDWVVLPTFSSNYPPVLTLGVDGRPVVGFATPGVMGVSAVAVAIYDGTGWNLLPPASTFGDAAAAGISVAVDSHEGTFVAWSDYGTGGRFINVRRWDGANWNGELPVLDAVPGSSSDALSPKMRLDRTDHPVVCWIENGDVFASRWTGSAWDPSWGGVGLSMATANDLTLDRQGNPSIAWRRQTSDQGISVWNGTWTTDSLPASSQPPTVAMDSTQVPIAAIATYQSIHLLRIASRQAVDATGPLVVSVNDQNPRLAIDATGQPAVTWLRTTARTLGFARWTGSSWDARAGAFDDGTSSLPAATAPQIVLDSSGTAWIAWLQGGLVNVRMTNY